MKLFKYITIMVLVSMVYSCEEPMLVTPDSVDRGVFVTFEMENSDINSGDIEGTPITGVFDVPASNVESHDVYVKRIYDAGESESDLVFVETISDFPYDFSIDGYELADLFNLPVEETFGNFYEFNCTATGIDGTVATYDNLHNDLIGSGEQLQGFRFRGAVICPSDPSVIIGTYSSLTSGVFPGGDPFVDFPSEVSITTSDDEGFYIISDYSFGTYDWQYGTDTDGNLPGTVQDVCGVFFITNTLDPWNEAVSGDFTFNDDGTITVEGGTTWGEVWTAVLTKIE